MAKYIDAEKLKAELKYEVEIMTLIDEYDDDQSARYIFAAKKSTLKFVLDLVEKLEEERDDEED